MINLLYVVVPVMVGVVVAGVMAIGSNLRARGRTRRSLEGGIDDFSRGLTALAPHGSDDERHKGI